MVEKVEEEPAYLEPSSGFHCASGIQQPWSFLWPKVQRNTQKIYLFSSLEYEPIPITHRLQADNSFI